MIIIAIIMMTMVMMMMMMMMMMMRVTHSKTIRENTVEIEPQPVALDFKNLCQYSSRSQ